MGIIKNYKFSNPYVMVNKRDYWDLQLSPNTINDSYISSNIPNDCLISYINVENDNCIIGNNLISDNSFIWDDAVNTGIILDDIGLTGIDNGLLSFRKDKISNEEFYNILVNSQITINSDDKRFFMHPVSGNTLEYEYPYEIINNNTEKYIAFKGGFYQGFYKLYGFDYQILPNVINTSWTFEFTIRKRDYDVKNNILNTIYPNNKGIFFYIGTRSENKFYRFYKIDETITEDNKKTSYTYDDYFSTDSQYKLSTSNIIYTDYFNEDPKDDTVITDENYLAEPDYINDNKCHLQSNYDFCLDPYVIWDNNLEINSLNKNNNIYNYFLNEYRYNSYNNCNCTSNIARDEQDKCKCLTHIIPNPYFYTTFQNSTCKKENNLDNSSYICGECDSYYADKYFDEYNEGCCDTIGYLVDEDYFMPEVSLENINITTTNEHEISKNGYYEIISDNKFLLFNNTPTGYTVNNWTDGLSVSFTGRTSSFKGNFYLLLNHTKTGYTINDIDEYLAAYDNHYDVINDITNNAFALMIKDDNSIGYRYLVESCNNKKYDILEEFSKPNIIVNNEWTTINIKITIIDNTNINKNRKMKLYFYVNGFLVFISKELPEFKFKNLNDTFDKQEGVPYNISLGGGTQGLCETVWLNYYELPSKILPLEKYFAGSFIGDFKSFKFYDCNLNYNQIKNNYINEKLNK